MQWEGENFPSFLIKDKGGKEVHKMKGNSVDNFFPKSFTRIVNIIYISKLQ